MRQNKYEYDAFISHAVEDKIPVANELCAKLERAGLKIWYSGKELGIGDSIEKTIEKGLNRSRYGIVIFSPTYLAKNWTIREFYTLLAKEIEEQKVILPVLYNISLDELKNKDLVMADRFAVNADRGIDFVVERLMREIKKPKPVKVKEAWFSRMWFLLVLSLLANVALLVKGTLFGNSRPTLDSAQTLGGDALREYPVHQRTLLGEMQGLFDQLNTCTCTQTEEKKPMLFRQTGLIRNAASPTAGASNFYREEEPALERATSRVAPGSKITMAVVLQIQSAAESAPGLEEEVDNLLKTINLSEKNDPYARVTSLEDPAHNNRECAHAHHLAD